MHPAAYSFVIRVFGDDFDTYALLYPIFYLPCMSFSFFLFIKTILSGCGGSPASRSLPPHPVIQSKRIFQIRSLPDSVKLLSRLISYPFSQKNQLFFVQFIKISEISIFRKNYVFVNRFFTISWYSVFSSVHYSVNICTIAAYRKSYIIFILKGVPSWTWKIT